MQIYFSNKSANDQEMMAEIIRIHNLAIIDFKFNLANPDSLEMMKSYQLEVVLNPRLKTKGGSAKFNRWTRKISIEINYSLHKQNMSELKNTYLHELGHAVDFFLFNSSSHDYRWQAITSALGGSTKRTHSMDTSQFKNKRTKFRYSCGCQTHEVSSIKHNKIQRGLNYKCISCGQRLSPIINLSDKKENKINEPMLAR